MLNVLATAMLPLIACAVVVSGLRRRLDLFSCFTEGAKKGMGSILQLIPTPVSYTHLDVYKRQALCRGPACG